MSVIGRASLARGQLAGYLARHFQNAENACVRKSMNSAVCAGLQSSRYSYYSARIFPVARYPALQSRQFQSLHSRRAMADEETFSSGIYAQIPKTRRVQLEVQKDVAVVPASPTTAMARKLRIRVSPYKLNDVAKLVRGLPVNEALKQLTFTSRRIGRTVVKKVVRSAKANAERQLKVDPSDLYVSEAFVGKNVYLRRISYHSKGRSGIKHHPFSRITVIVKRKATDAEKRLAAEAAVARVVRRAQFKDARKLNVPVCGV